MDVTNHVRTAEIEDLAAVLLAPEIVEGRVHVLNERTHCAVVNDNAFVNGF
jgi:hypothetical protein